MHARIHDVLNCTTLITHSIITTIPPRTTPLYLIDVRGKKKAGPVHRRMGTSNASGSLLNMPRNTRWKVAHALAFCTRPHVWFGA